MLNNAVGFLAHSPGTAALIAFVLRYLWVRYPEYRDLIDALATALGVGGGSAFLHSMRVVANGKNGHSSGNNGSSAASSAG